MDNQITDTIASAPLERNVIYCEPFQQNLYPKIKFPEFDATNYKINRIMNHYKYLDDERKIRNNLKKRYNKVSNATFGVECVITVSEIGVMATTLAVPLLVPFSAPISVGLTTVIAILRSSSGLVTNKINKHASIELLAKSKLDSIEEKFYKAIKDGKITEEEFNDIEQEIKNYNKMKKYILSEYNNGKKQPQDVGKDVKQGLIDQGKLMGRAEILECFNIKKHV